ncbi:MAG: hypothetical protein GF401_15185 [Chitinivibrionales bacterium]|nr:hypothetical protein [Chitinivibrionales bacterium]
MRLLHTKLPEFKHKITQAALEQGKKCTISGLENLRCGKVQSLRTGRIESAIEEIARESATGNVEVIVMPRVPETMHTVIVKGVDKKGADTRAIMEVVNIIHPTEEYELRNCTSVDDRRPPLGKH